MKVRKLEHTDIPEALELARQMHAESVYAELPFDDLKAITLGQEAIDHPEVYCSLVAEHAGEIVGMFLGFAAPHYFSHELSASDLLLYVPRTKRGGLAAAFLVKAYIKWARDLGVRDSQISVGITAGIADEKAASLYERLGFRSAGAIYKLG